MKSLERRFKNISKRNPFWSSHTCFVEAVKEQGFNKRTIHYWFLKLVDKDDYSKSDKKAILSDLEGLSKQAVEGNN